MDLTPAQFDREVWLPGIKHQRLVSSLTSHPDAEAEVEFDYLLCHFEGQGPKYSVILIYQESNGTIHVAAVDHQHFLRRDLEF